MARPDGFAVRCSIQLSYGRVDWLPVCCTHYTDAYQTCRNLFMSDEAEANSMPGLEINADQVKCSHGSTSARVSDEEIYYLCSRGIAPTNARRIIAQGFSADVIEKFEDKALETFALNRIEAKFSAVE